MTQNEISAVTLLTNVHCEQVFWQMKQIVSSSMSHMPQTKKGTHISTSGTPLAVIVVQTARVLQKHCNCFACLFFTPQEMNGGLNAPAGFRKCLST